MEAITAVVLLAVAAMPVALVANWFLQSGTQGLGSAVNRGDKDAWWRASMPWPRGVQEEDGLTWHLGNPDRTDGVPAGQSPARTADDGFEVAPVRAHGRIAARGGRRGDIE